MARFWDGWGIGVFVGFVSLIALVTVGLFIFKLGGDAGRNDAYAEMARQGGGEYVVLTMNGHDLKGWLR